MGVPTRRVTSLTLLVVASVAGLTLAVTEGSEGAWSYDETPIDAPAPRTFETSVSDRTSGQISCIHDESCNFYRDKLLVVKLNPVRLLWLDYLQRFYGAGMPNIVFFSSLNKGMPHDGDGRYLRVGQFDTVVHLVEDNYGFCDHYTIATAMAMYKSQFTGFVFLSDDVLVQYWRLVGRDGSRIWRQPPVYGEKAAGIEMGDSYKKAIAEINQLPGVHAIAPGNAPFASTSGIYYVPATYAAPFTASSLILLKHRTYNEWGTPAVLHSIAGNNFDPLDGLLVWGKKRLRARHMLKSSRHLWQHPVRAPGELFARATHFIYTQKPLTADMALSDAMFDKECFVCASYPSAGRKMKGVYHSCVLASSDDTCDQTPAQAVSAAWPELRKPELCGGRVKVLPDLQGIKCPFELQHEGFWGQSITEFMFQEHYPRMNRTSTRATLFKPYPHCCTQDGRS